jgi:hypothetical protein
MKRIKKMSTFEYSHILKFFESAYHSLLLVCDEALRFSIHFDKGLEYLCEGFRCLNTSNSDPKGNDTIVAVDSSEDSYCILMIAISSLLNDVIGQVIAHHLAI